MWLVPLRKGIHRALDLSLNHPLLRRVDAVQLVGDVNDDDSGIDPLFANKLINPHLSAKPSNGMCFLYRVKRGISDNWVNRIKITLCSVGTL